MATDVFSRNYNEVTAPVAGQVAVVNTSTTAASLDLSTVGPTSPSAGNSDLIAEGLGGCVNRYVRITAVSSTIGLVFANSNAGVTGNNAPNTSNTGVNANGCCELVFVGTSVDYLIHPSTQWMGYVALANGTLVVRPSSRGM